MPFSDHRLARWGRKPSSDRHRPAADRERRQEYGVLCVAALSGSFAPIMPNLRTKFLTVPSDLLREHVGFIEDLKEDYVQRGFRILEAESIESKLGYHPDLVVMRGNQITVVEVKQAGHVSPRIRELRQKAENLGYDFELKVIPRIPKRRNGPTIRLRFHNCLLMQKDSLDHVGSI